MGASVRRQGSNWQTLVEATARVGGLRATAISAAGGRAADSRGWNGQAVACGIAATSSNSISNVPSQLTTGSCTRKVFMNYAIVSLN